MIEIRIVLHLKVKTKVN